MMTGIAWETITKHTFGSQSESAAVAKERGEGYDQSSAKLQGKTT